LKDHPSGSVFEPARLSQRVQSDYDSPCIILPVLELPHVVAHLTRTIPVQNCGVALYHDPMFPAFTLVDQNSTFWIALDVSDLRRSFVGWDKEFPFKIDVAYRHAMRPTRRTCSGKAAQIFQPDQTNLLSVQLKQVRSELCCFQTNSSRGSITFQFSRLPES
jgi:hypothetical protein